jgi:hypothetical protein
MDTPTFSPAYNHFLDFIIEKATPQEILAFQLSDEERARIIALFNKQDIDLLSPEEAIELQQVVLVDRMLLVLKARALKALD